MKIINRIPAYKKLYHSTQMAIKEGMNKLKERLETYLKYNPSFDTIGMDDKLIHDAYISNGKRFFLYKCRIKTLSLRLLYTFENDDVVVISHICKKNARYEYFNYFETACEEYMFNNHNKNLPREKITS